MFASTRRLCALLAFLMIAIGCGVFFSGQRFGFRNIVQNNPPKTELVVARWRYTAMGKFRGTGWSHNYPSSDTHFVQVLSEATNINVTGLSYRIVDLGSLGVFDYPI